MRFSVLRLGILCLIPIGAFGMDYSELMLRGDAAYAQRTNLSVAQQALENYQAATTVQEKAVEPLWKIARTAWWIAVNTDDKRQRLHYLEQGIAAAQQALKLNPDSVEAHFWLGGNLGSYGEAKGVLKSLTLVKPIRHEMQEVLRLNDHYLGGGGYRVLGVVDYKVPGFAGGNPKRAEQELQKALAIDPQDPFTHYYLAEFYDLTGDKPRARAELQNLQTLQVPPSYGPELQYLLKKATKLSARLQ